MRIICIRNDIKSNDRQKISDTLIKLGVKRLSRLTTGSVYPGGCNHVNNEYIKRHADSIILDKTEAGSDAVKATVKPYGSKLYFVFLEEPGLEALSEVYREQVVAVCIGSEVEGWEHIDGKDTSDIVKEILSKAEGEN